MNARTISRAGFAAVAVAAMATLGPPASAVPAQVIHRHGATETFIDRIDCSDDPSALITITFNSVARNSTTPQGGLHARFTQSGTFTAVPLDGSQSATGRFSIRSDFNANKRSMVRTFTFTLQGKYADGTPLSVHEVEHFHRTPNDVESFFDKCSD